MRLVLFLFVLLWPTLVQATVLLTEDYEVTAGTLGSGASKTAMEAKGWGVFCSSTPCHGDIVASPTHSGSGALRFKYPYPIINDINDVQLQHQFTGATDIYTRFWIRYEVIDSGQASSFVNNTQVFSSKHHLYQYDETPQPIFGYWNVTGMTNTPSLANQHSNFSELCPNGVTDVTCNYPPNMGSAFTMPMNQWVCMEVHLQMNTPGVQNGVADVWANGAPLLHQTTVKFRDTGSSTLFHSIQLYRQGAVNLYRYEDDFAIGTTRFNDCPGAVQDTTPPTQVTGLAVGTPTPSELTITATNGVDAIDTTLNFRLERCTGTGCSNFALDKTLSATGGSITTTTDSGLLSATTYCFRANNSDQSGNLGPYSSTVCGTTDVSSSTSASASDDFNRANSLDLGANWDPGYVQGAATDTPLQIVGNRVRETSATDATETYNAVSLASNQYAQVTLVTAGTSLQAPRLLLRFAAPPTKSGYEFAIGRNGAGFTSRIGKWSAGTFTLLVSESATTWAATDVLRAEAEGTTLRLYRNGSLVLSTTDSTYTGGRAGVIIYAGVVADVELDDMSLGDLVAIAPALPTITNEVCDTTGCTLTAGAVTPTYVRYQTDTSGGVLLWTALVAGRFIAPDGVTTQANAYWPVGLTFACFWAQDATHTESTLDAEHQCRPLAGLTGPPPNQDHGPATGVLRQLGSTPWLTNDSGKAVMLVGNSNCFNCMEDWTLPGLLARGTVFNADVKFAALQTIGMKFVRFYHSEQSQGTVGEFAADTYAKNPLDQHPWLQVGSRVDSTSGTAITVGIYDLNQWNPAFFQRARTNVLKALSYGLTPSIMLFNGGTTKYNENIAWAHPFYSANNVNGVNCEQVVDGECIELQTTTYPALLARQRAYIEHQIDNINDIDGIIWEISSEDYSYTASQTWQDWVYDTIHNYEALGGRKVHPIWRTAAGWNVQAADNSYLFTNAKSQIVAPGGKTVFTTGAEDYELNPPYNTGAKVVFSDTDHMGTEVSGWPWKTFTRGHYPVFVSERETAGVQTLIETQMKQVQTYADKIDLKNMLPVNGTAVINSGYGLKEDCVEYLMFMPANGTNTITLPNCSGVSFTVEFLNIRTGAVTGSATVADNGVRSWNPSGSDLMVVYLKKVAPPADTTPAILSGGAPSGVLASGVTSVTMQVSTNEAATCKFGTVAGTAYAGIAGTFTTTGDLVHAETIGSLSDGNTYTYYIRCSNAASLPNLSDYPITWSITAIAPDVTPPSIIDGQPTGVLSAGTTSVAMTVTTDENATCKYSLTPGVSYAAMATTFTTTGTTDHSTPITGLLDSTNYTRYVKCTDGTNANVLDFTITWTVAAPIDTTPPTVFGVLPTGSFPSTTTAVTLQVSTDEASTCKYGSAAGVAYTSQPNPMTASGDGLTHTATIPVVSSTTYTRYVRCQDLVMNATTSDTTITWTVTAQLDTTPPVLSDPHPAATLPAGTTSTPISLTADELATCHYGATDVAYSAMTLTLTRSGSTHSATVTGLTDNSTTLYYARCQDFARDAFDNPAPNTNTASFIITVIVAAAPADVTPPGPVTSLTATVLTPTSAQLDWTNPVDADLAGVQIYECLTANCASNALGPVLGGVTTTTLLNLTANSTTLFALKALDTSLNLSAAFSNVVTVSTVAFADLIPPSTVTGFEPILGGTIHNTVGLTWLPGTDNIGVAKTDLYRCTGEGCTDFDVKFSTPQGSFMDTTVQPGLVYRYEAFHVDAAGNVSVAPSTIIRVVTPLSTVGAKEGLCPCKPKR